MSTGGEVRSGADYTVVGRRIVDLPPDLRRALSCGERETRTWTEWMGVDTAQLASCVAHEMPSTQLGNALAAASGRLEGQGILARLNILGRAISGAVAGFEDPEFKRLLDHRSDAVRQWGAYAVNDPSRPMGLAERLQLTLRFAADPHMTVRECAWMAFRPFLLASLDEGLRLLMPFAKAADFRLRRFAIEVSRPRSVWGTHCDRLKTNPELGRDLLESVRHEQDRYVQLATGNWINDASKTRPDWAKRLFFAWSRDGNRDTDAILARGMRTVRARASVAADAQQPSFHDVI